MSTTLELVGFTAITAAAYEWSGRPLAFFVSGCLLWFIAQGTEGIKPVKDTRAAALRLFARRKAKRAARASAKQ